MKQIQKPSLNRRDFLKTTAVVGIIGGVSGV
ncbi:MAG: twin-arginine translocation signal domain-containing protein [Campylobacter sp.]|nr:twin-arginine translocation signal domain-containing protein [Campylobacter sp.]